MGLFKKFKQLASKRLEKKILRNEKIILNAKAIRDDRVAAIDFFVDLEDSAIAVPALLKRFEYSLEHGINDTREKESAMEGIVSRGASAVDLVEAHLQKTTKIAWPIKILEKLIDEDALTKILFACLDFGEIALDQDKVDKNYDLLCHLRDFKLKEPAKLFGFMEAHDERLRFATAQALLSQSHADVPNQLERFLTDVSAENTRIRQCVFDAFVENKWTISDPGKLTTSGLVAGIYINSKNQLELRR